MIAKEKKAEEMTQGEIIQREHILALCSKFQKEYDFFMKEEGILLI